MTRHDDPAWGGTSGRPLTAHGDPLRSEVEALPPVEAQHDSQDDPEVRRIERDIAQVRGDLGQTVEEISARLKPAYLMDRAKATVKEVTNDRVRTLANSAGDMADTVKDRTRLLASEAGDQIRDYPLPTALLGVGLGWLAWSLGSSSRRDRSPGRQGSDRRGLPGMLSGSLPLLVAGAGVYLLWREISAAQALSIPPPPTAHQWDDIVPHG
jgi:hypothetical protein